MRLLLFPLITFGLATFSKYSQEDVDLIGNWKFKYDINIDAQGGVPKKIKNIFQILDTIKLKSDHTVTLFQVNDSNTYNKTKFNYSYGKWTVENKYLLLFDRVDQHGNDLPNTKLKIVRSSRWKLIIEYPAKSPATKKQVFHQEVFKKIR